ncbi:hypothetical protein BD289DRAFT_458951 [Coniella lustricola]|uniref:Geranylgeranyl pyrophosphate synthetase n=1 Tax=Coniella lustricola TaxID=2025994 RepID=A0A2T3AGN4_9PEZI|nr:hypothetical protein BD289DRAFT_458951 [Coniella lustricola]
MGQLLSSLHRFEFDGEALAYRSEATIRDCQPVASYNWLGKSEATVAIPGKPPRWTPPAQPHQLKLDSDEYFRDPNAANFPKHPMEPAVVAALTMDPTIAPTIDLVACSSTIGNLLRFVKATDKKFRILVESVGNTVFLIRRENTPRELIPDVKGYGHSFPEAYTSWDAEVKGSTSHQRVLSYRFGGLRCLVRFETDGYVFDKDNGGPEHSRSANSPTNIGISGAVDELTAALTGNLVAPVVSTANSDELQIVRVGEIVKQESLFELKTRSVKCKQGDHPQDTLGEQLPRLWVAQLSKFILAYHSRGMFEKEITIKDVRNEVKAWEKDNVDDLSRLAALLHRIMAIVRARPDGKLELRHDAVGVLEIREQTTDVDGALSERVQKLWLKDEDEDAQSASADQKTDNLGPSVKPEGTERTKPESGPDWHDWHDEISWDVQDFDSDMEIGWNDNESVPDFTACSAEDCGYCGKCMY